MVVALQNWLAAVLLQSPLRPFRCSWPWLEWVPPRLSQHQAQATARLAGAFHDKLRGPGYHSALWRHRPGYRPTECPGRGVPQPDNERVLRLAFLSSAVLEFFSAVAIATLAIYIGLGLLGYIELGPSSQGLTLASGLFILLLAPEFFFFSIAARWLNSWHDRADALACARRPSFHGQPSFRPDRPQCHYRGDRAIASGRLPGIDPFAQLFLRSRSTHSRSGRSGCSCRPIHSDHQPQRRWQDPPCST